MSEPKWTITEADTNAGILLAGEIVNASNTGDPLYYLPCIELIAAKRELYEALEGVLSMEQTDSISDLREWGMAGADRIVRGRTALAKARGE